MRGCACSCAPPRDRNDTFHVGAYSTPTPSIKNELGFPDCKSLSKILSYGVIKNADGVTLDFGDYAEQMMAKHGTSLKVLELCPVTYTKSMALPGTKKYNSRAECLARPGCCRLGVDGEPLWWGVSKPADKMCQPKIRGLPFGPAGTCSAHPNSTALMPLALCACPPGWTGAHCEHVDLELAARWFDDSGGPPATRTPLPPTLAARC